MAAADDPAYLYHDVAWIPLCTCGYSAGVAISAPVSCLSSTTVTFWCIFIAVGGNIIIHAQRYRLMLTLILFTCMWWGYTRCSRREVTLCALVWFGLLACGALFYIGFKFI